MINFSKLSSSIRNIIGHITLHSLVILATIFISGVIIAIIGGESSSLGFNLKSFYIWDKWFHWLKFNWEALEIDDYNYIKIKLSFALFAPIITVMLIYMFNYQRIISLKLFQKKNAVYGSAKWASQAKIEEAKLREKQGVLLGKDDVDYFVAGGFQHSLLFAPTGSGKGVGFVIPNLLFWEDSCVCHDIKLENYELTSGWRKNKGQKIYVWEPANPDGITHCYNPLDWISDKPGQMVDDVQKIANLAMPEKDFWNNEARSLFLGVVLYLIADENKKTSFGEVVRTLRSDDVIYHLSVVLDTMGDILHPVAYMNIAAFLQKAEKERSGVVSTLNSALELWANPLIDTATATSDFNFMKLKKEKTTIFVGLTPDNINRLQKLMQIFYQQAIDFLSRKIPDTKEEPYGVMFMMDEFPTLGKMEQFKAGIAYLRGYRVRLFLIVQDTQQLKGIYEEAGMNSFLSNSTYRITFAANNYETASLISQLCGTQTVEQRSFNKPLFSLNLQSQTQHISKVQRALLLPHEVIQLPRDEQILLIESFPPIKSKKIKYFEDKFFTKRLLPPTFVPKQKAYKIKEKELEEA